MTEIGTLADHRIGRLRASSCQMVRQMHSKAMEYTGVWKPHHTSFGVETEDESDDRKRREDGL